MTTTHPSDFGAGWLALEETPLDTAVSLILKLRGETCNIDCPYCFEKRKEEPGGAAITPDQISQLATVFGDRPLAVELHGGEPLTVGRPTMIAVLDALAAQPTVRRVQLQTNGLLLDEEWLDLFDAHCPTLGFGISLDGDAAGNAWRIGYTGDPIYPRVVAALDLLASRGKTCGIVTVVTPAVLGRAEAVIDHLAAFPAVWAVNLVPAFDGTITEPTPPAGSRTTTSREIQQKGLDGAGPHWAVTPAQYAEFVLAATARWITAGHSRRMKLDPAVATIRKLRGLTTSHCHFSNLKCSHVFTTYPDGRFGSCDELPWPAAGLAPLTLLTGEDAVTARQHRNTLLRQGQVLMDKCEPCPYRSSCGGGCAATRLRMIAAIGSDDPYCDHRARLIDGTAALLAAPDHPEGASCLRTRWRPRIPNEMDDPEGFLARWDDPDAPRDPVEPRTSQYGNINSVGQPGIHAADDLDPLHPCWRSGIEDLVWPLVHTITSLWKAVTYDSCQGHTYPGTELEPSVFRVGLLPRDRHEYAALAARTCQALARAEPYLPATTTLNLARTDLIGTADRRPRPVLEINISPSSGTRWDDYFRDLGQASRVLAHAARHTNPTTVCACIPRHPERTFDDPHQ